MSRKLPEPKGKRVNKLEYTPAIPSFLQNYGQPKPDPDSPPRSSAHPGREPLPERPRDGRWAGGSDDEGDGKRKGNRGGEEIEDEWDLKFGGGKGDDGPQVVVLKEGKHITKEELESERRKAAGLPELPKTDVRSSRSPPPEEAKTEETKAKTTTAVVPEPNKPSAHGPLAKRKAELAELEAEKKAAQAKRKKKSKAAKGMLSFGDDE